MDKHRKPDRASIGSSSIIVTLLLASLLSITSHAPIDSFAIPIVVAEDAPTTNSTSLITIFSLGATNSSTAQSSTSEVGNSTSPTETSNSTVIASSSTISNSTTVGTSLLSTQTTTTLNASTDSSTTEAVTSNTTTISVNSTTHNSTASTNSNTTFVTTSTTVTTDTSTTSTTASLQAPSSFHIDRWDWSTWNTISGLALWITNTGTEPLNVFSLSVTIGGSLAGPSLYPGLSQACTLRPILPQSQCLFMPTPSINLTAGNSYAVIITALDGMQVSFTATYGGRSGNPSQFAVDDVKWTSNCCEFVLNMRVTNTGGTPLDTNQMAASITFNGHAFATPAACGTIAPGSQCQLAFHIYTLASYVIMVTDSRDGGQLEVITP